MLENSIQQEGYIYIYKCIVGSHSDICKIGKTKHFDGRLKQHNRTLYYGFVPYCDFATGNPIATIFKVKNMDESDRLIKAYFKQYQVSTIEVYNIDYDNAIKKLYDYLNEKKQFINIIEDGISVYDFFTKEQEENDTTKTNFENIKQMILSKYNNKLPEELLILLKNKDEFIENCSSHYNSGNYIDFPNNLVLDIHYNKLKRNEILNKLKNIL